MTWALIGLIAGLVLGLTGAGGAMVSVPLFLYLQGLTIQEATVFSLFVVFSGALFNGFFQRQNIQFKIAIPVFLFSLLGSYLSAGIKPMLAKWVIQSGFLLICFFSLWRTWVPFRSNRPALTGKQNLIFLPLMGLLIGALITITGLGGGVVLIPFYISIVGLEPHIAVATSLFTVLINSMGSIGSQFSAVQRAADPTSIGLLMLGCLVASRLVILWMEKIPQKSRERFRRVLFTAIVLVTIVSVLLK